MTSAVRQQRHFLEFLLQSNPAQRKLILSSITRDQLNVLGEIAANVIHSVILLNPEEKKALKKYKSVLLVLGDKKNGQKNKRRLLKKKSTRHHNLVKNRKTFPEKMVDVMQKSVLIPYEKYSRLMTLQETHRANSEADAERVVAENVSENMIALPHPEESQNHDMSTQTESEDSIKPETTSANLSTKESEESLITEKPVFKKKKTIENKNIKAKSRYRLQTTWIRF